MLKHLEKLALVLLVALMPSLTAYQCASTDSDGDGYDSSVDCNDEDASIHPDQEEPCVCDQIDQNCNGIVDDFPCDMACFVDEDGDGYDSSVDCNDADSSIHPDQEEPCVCDQIDQNCNGSVDDFPCDMACPTDLDGDGYAAGEDCNDSDPSVHPGATEPCLCDAIDQDCNGKIDDSACMGPAACEYQGEGETCSADKGEYCAPGMVCCYPCGIPDCQNVCMIPCYDSWCVNGCPLYP